MHIRQPNARGAVLVVAMVGMAGCVGPRALGPVLPQAPLEQPRCKVAASQASPLVTEWPASEKANLEALLREGGVLVSYSGCAMRLLPHCRLPGGYAWQRTTPAADYFEISNEDELYTKLPLGAVSLEGELKRSGKLSVQTVVSGLLRLAGAEGAQVPDWGECVQATHVVSALSVGAFTLSTGSGLRAGAAAGVTSIGQVGGSAGGEAQRMRAAGDPQSCGASTDQAPHPDCRSPIQVFLQPLPGRVAMEGPPGTVAVEFVAANADGRWDVYIDDEVVCSTPCSRWVSPSRPILLRARTERFFAPPDRVQLPGLGEHAAAGSLQVQAHPTSLGKLTTGITFTGFGGMATLTGITLTAVGCAAGRSEGMCTGGLISLGVGSLVTAGAIWLILDAAPRAEILPSFHASLGRDGALLVRAGPGFVVGSF